MKSPGIRARILLVALAPATLVAVLVTALLVAEQATLIESEQQRRLAAVAQQLASAAAYHVFVGNHEALANLISTSFETSEVVAAAFLSPDGKPLASTVPVEQLPKPDEILQGFGLQPFSSVSHHWLSLPIRLPAAGGSTIYGDERELEAPPLGSLLVKITTEPLRNEMRWYALKAAGYTLVMLAFGALLALAISHRLVRALTNIGAVVKNIEKGRHDLRVDYGGDDELGRLGHGINVMADAVARSQEYLNERIATATATLRRERDEAAQAAEARSRFFAAASHDLRQPVQAIGLFFSQLEREASNTPWQARMAQIAKSLGSLQSLLDALLDYSRLSGNVYQVDVRAVNAHNMLTLIHSEFQAKASAKGVRLRLHTLNCEVVSDSTLLYRILINLVSNAISNTDKGDVLLACRRNRSHARIEVRDTGCGIPADKQAGIFEEMVQLHNPERDPSKGIGLGLAIVKRTADLLHHPLRLDSIPGRGSCFSITIPLAPQQDEDTATRSEDGGAAVRILVIGEPSPQHDEMVALLDGWGFETQVAADADAVLTRLQQHDSSSLLLLESADDAAAAHTFLDRCDAAAGKPLAALLIHSRDGDWSDKRHPHRIALKLPLRPARLRALIGYLSAIDDSATS